MDPHKAVLRGQLLVGGRPGAGSTLSLVPATTAEALIGMAGACAIFWTARQVFADRGIRTVAKAVAGLGLFVSVAAIVQRTSSAHRIYGLWQPVDTETVPFGPFVNRNHFATWMVLAIPLTAGYLLAHLQARDPGEAGDASLAGRVTRLLTDTNGMWLAGSVLVMTVGLFASFSRSGVIGLAAAVGAGAWLARGRLQPTSSRNLKVGAIVLVVALAAFANLGRMAARFGDTLSDSSGHRLDIWRDTLPVVRDFWLTGTGAGTYSTAMLVYQTSDRSVFFNQAHNHYLQLLAEGGLLLTVPVLLALAGLLAAARRALAADSTPRYWLRVGALAGLCGAGVQSIWETGLRMPANAVLFAVLAAVALHAPRVAPNGRNGTRNADAQRRNQRGAPRQTR
ncbi:MAG TPA: O-antigen ligase family protein [Vicinamibacterales bacterium]|nr:O-antigen ligase family protein [Vicinamibacterales bacterium]